MNEELFANLSRSAQEQYLIQDEILRGHYGQPGDVFLTTRALAEQRRVSVVTAHNILAGLCSAGYIELRGKRYYLSHSELLQARNNQARVIGLIVPQINNEFYSSLAEAVVETAGKHGYRVLLMSSSYSPAMERRVFQTLVNLNVAGIINCVPTPSENLHIYLNCPLPCVMLGHSLDKSKISSVQVNSFSISQKVAQNLIEEGYKRFIYIGTKNLVPEHDIRFTAFRLELRQRGYELDEDSIFRLSSDSFDEEARLSRRLVEIEEPVGIFCYHDLLAVQVYRLCSRLSLSIPEDVGVVGFDDLSVASSLTPPLTTVQYRIATMADMAITLLLTKIKTPSAPYDNYYIEPNLIIRKSAALSGKGKD